MILQEALDIITNNADYVPNSLILKNYDDNGATYKWLQRLDDGIAERNERFFAFAAGQSAVELTQRALLEVETIPVIYNITPAK